MINIGAGIYGGIDKDFATIPFFGKVKNYVSSLWQEYKQYGFVKTEYLNCQEHHQVTLLLHLLLETLDV